MTHCAFNALHGKCNRTNPCHSQGPGSVEDEFCADYSKTVGSRGIQTDLYTNICIELFL